jgi:L-lysine 2,3-aminomutase
MKMAQHNLVRDPSEIQEIVVSGSEGILATEDQIRDVRECLHEVQHDTLDVSSPL